jgi:N-methylhydantoinase A
MTDPDRYLIGVDIGGTFTDAVVVAPDGGITVGKVSTTPEDFSQGFFASITAAAAALGLEETRLWRRTERLAHGTTVGINALVTGDVARTAYIATRGHGDSIRAMGGGGRILGASLEELLDYRLSSRAEPLVPRERVVEVSERLDRDGKVVVSLSDAKLEEILTRLEALDVQAVAISYLWSFVNSVHEERTAQYLRDARPDLFISCSHEIAPRIGEYPRSASTLLNAQIGPLMTSYIERIVAGSRERGLGGDLLFAQSEGSLVPASEAALFPLRTLQSGPVAGVVGSARVGPSMGYPKAIITDMGGTTLDAATVENGGVRFREDGQIVRQRAYLRKVEVESVGAGGGSIAWVHEASGTLRVGPRSAGALPGPICYGRGGNEVTVTDADLVLGILDADRPLAGGLRLDLDAARAGIERVGAPLGLSVDECAAGIVEIVDSRMEDLIRRITIQRGADPRSFSLFAFGGASGAHAGLYARGIGVSQVVFPQSDTASVWSAYGLTRLDQGRSFEANVFFHTPFDPKGLDVALKDLEGRATRYAEEHGLASFELRRSAGMKYPLQIHEVEVDLPEGPVDEAFVETLIGGFHRTYEREYGAGTGYAEAGVAMTSLRVGVHAACASPAIAAQGSSPPTSLPTSTRSVYWRELGGRVDTPIHCDGLPKVGTRLEGPVILQSSHTTIVARPGQTLEADEFGNLLLRLHAEPVAHA